VGSNPLDVELAEMGDPMDLTDLGAATAEPGFFDKVRLDDFRMIAGPSLWFSMANARAQLAGELTIDKIGSDLRITGTLEGNRGTYTLEAGPVVRRFDIAHAEVRFLGATEINPAIDITARRVVVQGDRDLQIDVRIGGTLKTPMLTLGSADASNMPQSELLSYLLFGQGTLALTGAMLPGEDIVLDAALGSLSDFAAERLEAVGLGFDIIQLRLGGGGLYGLASPTLVVGREVSNNLFLTLEAGFAGLFAEPGEPAANNNTSTSQAIRLEWRMNPQTSLRLGWEKGLRRQIRGLGVALPVTPLRQQATIELRRRWSW
jgi:hypothetical protein